jgi:hypothetical protein
MPANLLTTKQSSRDQHDGFGANQEKGIRWNSIYVGEHNLIKVVITP